MTQVAQVKEIYSNGQARVAVVRKGACSHDCSKCGGCTPTAALPTVMADADNRVGAHVGDTVLVESDSAPVSGLAAIMYLLPMVLLVLGYVMGQLLHLSELGSIGTAALAFALSVGILILVDRRLKRSRSMTFRIIQIKGA